MIEVIICSQDDYDANQKEDTYICEKFSMSKWKDNQIVINFTGLTNLVVSNKFGLKSVPVDLDKMIVLVNTLVENAKDN